MDGARDVAGVLGGVAIYLADTPTPYRHVYSDTVEPRRDVAGTDTRAEVQRSTVREWKIDDWSGGFGFPVWNQEQANRYNTGKNACPEFRKITYDGLVLGPEVSTVSDDSPATFAPDASGLWYGSLPDNSWLTVYGTKTRAIHPWLVGSAQFDATAITVGPVGGSTIGIADPGDGFLYVLDSVAVDLYKVDADAPTNVLHFDRSVGAGWGDSVNTAITAYRGEVYVLGSGGDLFRIDRSTTNTSTKVVDAFYSAASNTTTAPNRMATSDVGPVWFHNTRLGTDIWEFNVGEDSATIIGTLESGRTPWSIYTVGGFVFVAYSDQINTAVAPNVYLYYFRGGQTGTLGPLTDVADGYKVNISGVYQDRFILVTADTVLTGGIPFDLWAYDLSEGAWHHWAQGGLTPTTTGAGAYSRLLGREVLVDSTTATTKRVELIALDDYVTVAEGSAYVDTGRYDFDLPGTVKLLTDITVITDPLPANTTVSLLASFDGAAFTNSGSAMQFTTDGATSITFNRDSLDLTFYDLELRIQLTSTVATATPKVRSVTARAIPISVQEYWDLEVDLNPTKDQAATGVTTVATTPQAMMAALVGLKTGLTTVEFVNPWETDTQNGEASTTERVVVSRVIVPDVAAPEGRRVANVRLTRSRLS